MGYVVANIRTVSAVHVGDTMTLRRPTRPPRPCRATARRSRWSSRDFYPGPTTEFRRAARSALEKLQLNDAALTFQPINSEALGFGFRCGFLGLLHMDIVQERLEREHDIEVVQTAPTVPYQVLMTTKAR